MKVINKLVVAGVIFLVPMFAYSASDTAQLESVYINLGNKASLQRGATIFSNYCLSCHSAAYSRYNRVGADLGISDENMRKNLMFAGDKVGDLMKTTMPEDDAQKWFGIAPPDLSLIARSKDPDWLYTYMKSFYIDENSESGWNNTLFENVAMPHALFELEGNKKPIFSDVNGHKVLDHFEQITEGKLTPQEYDATVTDLVNFLVYLGEPAQLKRYKMGVFVLLFLVVLLIPCFLMKKEYWRDIH